MSIGTCKDCGASVIWSTTTNGSRVPLNPIPTKVAMPLTLEEDAPVIIKPARQLHVNTCTKKPACVRTRN